MSECEWERVRKKQSSKSETTKRKERCKFDSNFHSQIVKPLLWNMLMFKPVYLRLRGSRYGTIVGTLWKYRQFMNEPNTGSVINIVNNTYCKWHIHNRSEILAIHSLVAPSVRGWWTDCVSTCSVLCVNIKTDTSFTKILFFGFNFWHKRENWTVVETKLSENSLSAKVTLVEKFTVYWIGM